MTSLKDDTADDRELLSVHVVLLVAISGVLLSSGANVVLRRLGQKCLPPAATSVACGLIVGALARIHSHLNDSGIPWELGFDGPIFFLLLLPIINFDSGISLRRGPFFRQLWTILTFSIVGTLAAAIIIGLLLHAFGEAGWTISLSFEESMALAAVLAATDGLTVGGILDNLDAPPALVALVLGEGSVSDAVSIVMYSTFVGFMSRSSGDPSSSPQETAAETTSRFFSVLCGSVGVGLAFSVVGTYVYRGVYRGWIPFAGLWLRLASRCGCCCGGHCRVRHGSSTTAAVGLLNGGGGDDDGSGGLAAAYEALRNERAPLLLSPKLHVQPVVQSSALPAAAVHVAVPKLLTKAVAPAPSSMAADVAAAADAGSATPSRRRLSNWASLASPTGSDESRDGEFGGGHQHQYDHDEGDADIQRRDHHLQHQQHGLFPSSTATADPSSDPTAASSYATARLSDRSLQRQRSSAQVGTAAPAPGLPSATATAPEPEQQKEEEDTMTYEATLFLLIGYCSYMGSEAVGMSGVVAVLFAGIGLNYFTLPLLSKSTRAFTLNTSKAVASAADTAVFFQVGLDIALTIGTKNGIDTAQDVSTLVLFVFAVMFSRALAIFPIAQLASYLRREPIPLGWQVQLWHAGMRGAGTYAFALVWPTANRDVIVDLTAAVVLVTVILLGATTVPVMRLTGSMKQPLRLSPPSDVLQDCSKDSRALAAGAEDDSSDGTTTSSNRQSSRNYHTLLVAHEAKVYIPTAAKSRRNTAERAADWVNRGSAKLRWWVSGIRVDAVGQGTRDGDDDGDDDR